MRRSTILGAKLKINAELPIHQPNLKPDWRAVRLPCDSRQTRKNRNVMRKLSANISGNGALATRNINTGFKISPVANEKSIDLLR